MTKHQLPHNPFVRSPIKNLHKLSGRAAELKEIRYYLGQVSGGQSTGVALIGSRGVGKTSLLNAAVDLAKDFKLLTVRIDLNVDKAQNPGEFWIELYTTLFDALSSECAKLSHQIDGEKEVYGAFAGILDDDTSLTLKFPRHVAYQGGQHGRLTINESFLSADLTLFYDLCKELKFHGLLILIDEGDCFSKNQSLLQQLRNVFQSLDGFGLLMAGTDDLFPALAEVFSPIPRQFFKLEVLPFSDIWQALEMVELAIPEDLSTILPTFETMGETHDITGGDPAELQLYFHHMYKAVEVDVCKKMELHPTVLNNVAKEYRSGSSDAILRDIELLESLDEDILVDAWWLQLSKLTSSESISLVTLSRELNLKKSLDEKEISDLSIEVTEPYERLFDLELSGSKDQVVLNGQPLIASYWKSLVQTRYKKGFSWDDSSFSELITRYVLRNFVKHLGEMPWMHGKQMFGPNCIDILRKDGNAIEIQSNEFVQLITIAHPKLRGTATDYFTIESEVKFGGSTFYFRGSIRDTGEGDIVAKVDDWIRSSKMILSNHNIEFCLENVIKRPIPSTDEMHRLALINGRILPREFGPTFSTKAVSYFKDGDYQSAIDNFSIEIDIVDLAESKNNRAFCKILIGDYESAKIDIESAILKSPGNPLFQYNAAILDSLLDKKSEAIGSLMAILRGQTELVSEDDEYIALLGLIEQGSGVVNLDSISLLTGTLFSLVALGALEIDTAKDLDINPDTSGLMGLIERYL